MVQLCSNFFYLFLNFNPIVRLRCCRVCPRCSAITTACTHVERGLKKCALGVQFFLNLSINSVCCVKKSSNLMRYFIVRIQGRFGRAFCLCFQRPISIMLRDLQGVFHLRSFTNDTNEALILKPARDGHKGEIDREQEKTCQPRYSDY